MGSYKYTEIRKLPSDYLDTVAGILEEDEQWKRFMSLIPKNLADLTNENYEPKYDGQHIRLIENYVRDLRPKVNYAKVMFSEWGTSGRVRPTVDTVQKILLKGEMYKAAEQIASQLGEAAPPRPSHGPAARIDISITRLLIEDSDTQADLDHFDDKSTKKLESINLMKFPQTTKQIPELQPKSASYINNNQSYVIGGNSADLPISALLNPPSEPDYTGTSINDSDSQSHYHPTETTASQTSYGKSFKETQSTNVIESHYHPNETTASQASYGKSFKETQSTNVITFHFSEVEMMTNNFTSAHIGSGLFGDVFLGCHPGLGKIAVKKACDQNSSKLSLQISEMFQSEFKTLSMLKHRNIVSILGISLDGLVPCIVCEYVDGGSLKQKIAEKVLNESQRIKIMSGTAEGLKYIHNFVKPSLSSQPSQKAHFVHKDVKSANILLTKYFVPKLCDFGLTENFDVSVVQSDNKTGTPAYMAPESSCGTITQKGDVYSYGIVMLEIITGKTAVVYENHEQMNIKDYVQENIANGNITPLLDTVVDKWVHGQSLYDIAVLCLNKERTLRPTMDEICIKLSVSMT